MFGRGAFLFYLVSHVPSEWNVPQWGMAQSVAELPTHTHCVGVMLMEQSGFPAVTCPIM